MWLIERVDEKAADFVVSPALSSLAVQSKKLRALDSRVGDS